jgi:hypothetical protein
MRFTSRITDTAFQELLRPKLRLFLSADIVGSSDLKYQQPGPDWVFPIQSFYIQFPVFLDEQVTARTAAAPCPLEPPLLWKALGDELIFVVELKHLRQAALYVESFADALRQAAINWARPPHPLRFKGTAWLAGFPLINAEVPLDLPVIGTPGEAAPLPDFVGPQIDTGFRLKDHATPRKVVLSAELAYLLLSAESPCPDLYFDGDQPLKGILRGRPYPLIWIDSDKGSADGKPTLNQKKDILLGRRAADKEALRSYLDSWLQETGGLITKPFITNDESADLCKPSHYAEMLSEWSSKLRSLLHVQEPAPNGDPSGPEADSLPPELERLLQEP